MIFRLDDISPNTNLAELEQQVSLLRDYGQVILGVNLFSKRNEEGSVYPSPPFRSRPQEYFYDVNQIMSLSSIGLLISMEGVLVASHGMIHARHDELHRDAIEMSILTSCNILRTRIFIPPFNLISPDVESVCAENAISLVRNDEKTTWRSLETENLDRSHEHWYFHPWRVSLNRLKERLS